MARVRPGEDGELSVRVESGGEAGGQGAAGVQFASGRHCDELGETY